MDELNNQNFSELLGQFLEWYRNDRHSEDENFYDDIITKDSIMSI